MKGYFFRFFFFSFILCHLSVKGSEKGWDIFQDEAIENHSFSSTEGLLSSIIAHHVSAISGEFVDQATDCVLVGPEPLTLQRSYTPQPSIGMFGFEALSLYPRVVQLGIQFCGWQFNHFTTLHFQADSTKHARHTEASAFVPHVFFSQMLHRQQVKITAGKHNKGICSLPLLHQKGITNCSLGAISGRTNPKNVVAHFKNECTQCDVTFGSGNIRHYAGNLMDMSEDGQIGIWKFFPRYEKKANGNQIIYGDEQAYAYNASETTLYSWFKFLWVSKKELKVKTSHFKDPIIYHYEPFKTKQAQPNDRKERYYLTSLQRPDQPHESYEYIPDLKKEAWLLHRKILPDQRVLEIDYYQMRDQPGESHKTLIDDHLDPRLHRVKCLKAPVGADATPLVTHQFFYDLSFKIDHKKNRVKTYEGCTTVYDAYNRKSSYFYNQYQRLERLIQYVKDKPYVQTKYLWEDISRETKIPELNIVWTFSSENQGNLLGKVMLDGKGIPLWGRFFYYDERGNIKTEKFVGNLTGTNSTALLLDKHRLVDNGAESYQRHFIYSNDDYNLLLEEKESNGRKMKYAYQPNSDLIRAKFLFNHHTICIREFYEYDENNALITYICDNGTQEQQEDLSDVTERHITRYSPRREIPVGLPEIIDELIVVDFETQEEKLIKRTKREYSLQGRILKQHVYHGDDVYGYTLEWEYDNHGNITKEVNALGHVIYREYDDNDNLTKERGPDPDFEAIHEYDFSNRRISTEIHTNEHQFVTKTLYDLVGNRIAHIDRYGNRTSYTYDDLNRLICTTYPLTSGESEPSTTKLEYDCLGNVIKEINALDFATKKTYNARGKVTSILHPDGQLEQFEYRYDGSLAKKIASNGTETHFEVDCFGRILSETVYSAQGKCVQKISQTFDSLHKTSSTDATGLVTYYTYDKAGKLIKTVCQDKIEIYEYDLLGRLAKKKEPLEENKIKVTCTEYDFLDHVIEERIEDEQGQLFKKVSYQYDFFGNRTHVIEETQAGLSQHVTLYNSDKKPIKIIDPENNETHFSYTYTLLNELDQFVLQMTMTDPLGRQVITTYDARERPVTIKKVDPFGLLLAQQEITYDGKGQILSMIDHVIVQGEDMRCIETSFAYQKMGQLTCLTLAKDLPEQQITRFKYNAYGEKKTVIKGDGTLLNYTYDALGRVSTYFSNENSLSYQYTYNSRNQPLEVKDLIQKTSSLFNYDERGRLETETLSTGVALSYEYDQLDRVIALILPDTSRVNYEYDVAHLKRVARVKNQQLLYAHQYEAFDLTGLNLKATAINHQESAYTYDLLRRSLTIENDTYQQHTHYDIGNRVVQHTVKDPVGSLQIHYTYDDNDHLLSEQGHINHLYACDSLHNRLSKNQQTSTSNALHQLLDNGESTFSYDHAGNLDSKQTAEATTTYRYDAADRLIALQSDKETRYLYDAFHRRVAKIEGNKTTRYLYVGQDEIGSLDEEGHIQELRILGQGVGAEIGATIAIELQDQVFAPSHDLRGNIVCLADLQGNPVETYRYTAFGETTIYNAKGEKTTTSLVGNPWRFSSKRVDEESGFIFFGRRYYDAENGRWITADPAGLTDGPNLYAYLHHHPTHGFDLYGLQEETNQAQEPYYPLQNVDYHENENEKSQEDAMPNEAPLGFIEKRSGKKQRLFFCGLSQVAELGIGFMNGIMNSLQDAYETSKALSKMVDDHYVTFSYNKSHGFLLDVIRCFCELYLYMKTPAVRNLQTKWDAYFAHASPHAMYYHECHSEGAIITRNALMSYPEEYRKRIIVAAFAPGAYIDDKYAYQVTHYRSTRDIVPFFDFVGAFRCRHTTVVLKPHPDAPWLDHSIDSPTFQPYRYEQLTSYQKKYGGSTCAQSSL